MQWKKGVQCNHCSGRKSCQDNFMSTVFFVVGIVSIVAIRIVIFLGSVNEAYGKIAWYIGVIGFLFFFLYKYTVSHRREKIIENNDLLVKMSDPSCLMPGDYDRIRIILCSLVSKKEKVNFAFIFIISAISLAWATYVDFIR
ncbi:hypothetical protein ACFL3D_03655 [Candidatus Omnitrophota bacterium]